MSPSEEQYAKDVLSFFYPDDPPSLPITVELGDLAAEMLHEALKGSKALDLVPRPAGFKPGLAWLLSEAVRMVWRLQAKQRIYEAVRRTVAVKCKSRYGMTRAGV